MIKISRESGWYAMMISARVTLNRTQTQKLSTGESANFEISANQQNGLLQINCGGAKGTFNLTDIQNIEEVSFKLKSSDIECTVFYKDGGTEFLQNQTPPPMTFFSWRI